jgi:hypothetical protein
VPDISNFSFSVPATEYLQLSKLPNLSLFDFLNISGSLTFKRVPYTATLNDGTSIDTWAIVMNSADGSVFAGINGPASNSDATGLSVAGVDGAMAIIVPKDSADKRRWVAAAGTGNAVSLIGLPDLSISATNFAVELNKSLGTATGGIPNASIVDFNANPLNVLMDDGSTVTITHPASSGALLKVATDATITVADFFRVNGSFGVQTSTRDVSLSDGSSVNADVLMLGGKNASAFAGVNGGSANAAGLALTGVDFGFITAADKLDGAQRWNTLQATAANVAALGIPDTTITGSNLAVAINRPDENGLVANYKNDRLSISRWEIARPTRSISTVPKVHCCRRPELSPSLSAISSKSPVPSHSKEPPQVSRSPAEPRQMSLCLLSESITDPPSSDSTPVTPTQPDCPLQTRTLPSQSPQTSPIQQNAGPLSKPASTASASPDSLTSASPPVTSTCRLTVRLRHKPRRGLGCRTPRREDRPGNCHHTQYARR